MEAVRPGGSSAYSDPQWIQVDLGASYSLSRVKISWETAYARGFKVQLSSDGTAFTDLFTTTSNNSQVNDLSGLPASSGRYLRIYGTSRATVWGLLHLRAASVWP